VKHPIVMTVAEARSRPFRYVVFTSVFQPVYARKLADNLNNEVSWRLRKADYFKFFENDSPTVGQPGNIEPFSSPDTLTLLRSRMEKIFAVSLSHNITVAAHRLQRGQYIGIHNDRPGRHGETHRLVVNLSHQLSDGDGGFLVFFNSGDAMDIHRAFRPSFNSGVAFKLSAKSYHAVSRLKARSRLTLVYSFREQRFSGIGDSPCGKNKSAR
jgi:hypothetical protein